MCPVLFGSVRAEELMNVHVVGVSEYILSGFRVALSLLEGEN